MPAPAHGGDGPTRGSRLSLLAFPSPASTPVPIPVPALCLDASFNSSKGGSANNAVFQPAPYDLGVEPYCQASALPSPAPELYGLGGEPYCHASALPSPAPELYLLNDTGSDSLANWGHLLGSTRALSTISCDTQTSSSAGSLLSPVQTDRSDTLTARSRWSRGPSPLGRRKQNSTSDSCSKPLLCLGPQCKQTFTTEDELKSHVESVHTHSCNWAGCSQPSFASRDGLIWHVKEEHLLICPFEGCTETSLTSIRVLRSHMDIAHSKADGGIREWQLTPTLPDNEASSRRTDSLPDIETVPNDNGKAPRPPDQCISHTLPSVLAAKTKYQDQLRCVLEKRSKKNASTPRSADSPSDLVRCKASRLVETASFPLVYEHSILPFLSEFLPKWVGNRHVVSVTRGKTPQMKRICIMTRQKISRARKMIIMRHVQDLLPDKFRRLVSFFFTRGEVDRTTWARGLSKNHMDDICVARNPYFFRNPCMGDSIGICGNGTFENSTATLGPNLIVGGGSYWLGNFHPFLDAYQHLQTVTVEHPSLQDRGSCIAEGHDAMAQEKSFKLGNLEVTSGLNLQTTRISHDPYWEEIDMEPPLIITDWSLIASRTSNANLLRRFPSETQPLQRETPIITTCAVIPGAYVASSGRTSGHQRGQICEIPAYVSGEENGTKKATREWFIEEPYPYDNEEEWIRGGIGIEGDSGAAVVDSNTNALVGHLWGRNRYWGPGPRHTFFSPIADIFDDIQEKCGQQTRPQLPQHRDEADCFPPYPSCRQCYDKRTYLDSRRSSRISLQSMIMGKGDSDQDLTSIEAVSELATPGDYHHRFMGLEEAGSSFNVFCPGTPAVADMKSPYATTLEIDDADLCGAGASVQEGLRKRGPIFSLNPSQERHKRQRVDD
ncbi:hypothetical protein EDB81DRAFT_646773 [Dactylonectria macrodidyma]|uniref:C2H2-type domain-containing protein n=1 Tax=Dactylonectria macrodidyma TaxID=307937 RepID=A0A9P9FAK3_9HYPO|nr:hypothetical protein EDB81DRAFT_646773 [Dactylonectria macrodidyma]